MSVLAGRFTAELKLSGTAFVSSRPMPPASVPASTYRLQLTGSFTFADASAIVEYLATLGISHCYTSSYLRAVPGSTHGYDVADPTQLNPEIGDEAAYLHWVETLRSRGMGHIIDLVPNHMGIARSANPWWQDVLENGESSRYAEVFDVDWAPLKSEMQHQVLLPVLGDVYGAVLEQQEIVLEYGEGSFRARYYDNVFPLSTGTYDRILSVVGPGLVQELGDDHEAAIEFLSILTAIRHLPGRHGLSMELRLERDREKEVIKKRLAALTNTCGDVLRHINRVVTVFNGVPGSHASFDALDALMSAQAYRLAYWRVAAEEINYRRFFDINELAAIRMEDPFVFERAHAYVFELIGRGLIDGLRIDHVDGLFEPGDYLRRLRARAAEMRPDAFSDERPIFVVVEKILGHDEPLPDWPVEGTTGYDFLVMQNGLFVDGRNERAMNGVYEQFSRLRDPFREIVYRGKQLVLRVTMASELNVLAHQLNRISERHRHYRDYTLNSLSQAIREIISCFPVYRTYINEHEPVTTRDRAFIERATREAKRRNPNRPRAVYDFVADVLLQRAGFISQSERAEHLRFIGKFQQLTSPVTAKGIEDTALYIYNRLVSLNEVGGEPDHFGTSPEALHGWLAERARRWPHGLSTTSTHDTKRSEDVRARLNVLSEIPGAWKQAAGRWARTNRRARSIIDDKSYPSRNEEYLYYQTLLGSWPLEPMDADAERIYVGRIVAYMHKAMREAKVYTNWINPDPQYEEAMAHFVEETLSPANAEFRDDFVDFWRRLAQYGIINSLAQVALKIGAPGVPDFYQGTELWDFSLVDPDNRRPVDYARRQALLAELDCAVGSEGRAALAARLMQQPFDDRVKLYTAATLLRFRRDHRPAFEGGSYVPLAEEGARRDHVFGFMRRAGTSHALVLVPRLVASLSPDTMPLGERVWSDTRILLPPGAAASYRHALTDRMLAVHHDDDQASLRAAEVFDEYPVAFLEPQ